MAARRFHVCMIIHASHTAHGMASPECFEKGAAVGLLIDLVCEILSQSELSDFA